MSQLLIHHPVPAPPAANPTGPDQGVIEEARRRQRQRRVRRTLIILCTTAFIGALVWGGLAGGSSHPSLTRAAVANHAIALDANGPWAAAFNVRLYPYLEVGQAGWCTAIEEHGVTGTSACGGIATTSKPFLMVQGFGECSSRYSTTIAVTIPQVAAIRVDGQSRIPTTPLPGLPYGLRGARIVTASEPCTPSGRLPRRDPSAPTLTALDVRGRPIPQGHSAKIPFQAAVRSWRYPSRPPRGACSLSASGLTGLSARGGQVASAIQPFPGQIVGHAFLPCIATMYQLQGMPLKAMIVLDAQHPGTLPAAIPGFKPVPHASGLFGEGGSLTARRSGDAWLVVGQGSGLTQRINLLRHLTVTMSL
jgi:hypothetical protein